MTMTPGILSPVMLIASDGLIQNQGLAISGNLTLSVNAYNSTAVIDLYTTVLSNAVPAIGTGNANITQATFGLLQNLAGNILPAVTNAVPAASIGTLGPLGNTYTGGFSGIVTAQAELEMGSGDLSKFAQIYGIAQSYIVQTNQYINSVVNSNILNPTFVDMNSLTTGGVSEVNSNLPAFGEDLAKLGQAWDLSNLNYFGYPSALLYQLIKVGGLLPAIVEQLNLAGVSNDNLLELRRSGTVLAASVDALIYRGMQNITGDTLSQVLLLLDVTTPNLTTMADLLNPVKTLPSSYLTLTVSVPTGTDSSPTASVAVPVYLSSNTVNSNISSLFVGNEFYSTLTKITQPDQALANQAIAVSLQQVKDIFSIDLPALAAAVITVETNAGLTDIDTLTQPVPDSIQTSFLSLLATGSGPNGTLNLFDFLGAAAGTPYSLEFDSVTATVDQLLASGALDTLTGNTGVYTVMLSTLDGDYTTVIDPGPPEQIQIDIPSPLPGFGTYTSLDEAFTTGLIPAAQNLISNIATANTTAASSLNSSFSAMADQLAYEITNLTQAGVEFADLTAGSTASVLSIGTNLHQIGQDVGPDGQNAFFTAIADTTNIYGQAVIASLREGRNIAALNEAGIALDTQIPLDL
jgi:hypothetical protein